LVGVDLMGKDAKPAGCDNVIPAKAGIQSTPAYDLRGSYDDTRDTWVPVSRLRGDRLFWNDMDLVRRGFVHKKQTGGLDSGLRRNDMGRDEHGHSLGGHPRTSGLTPECLRRAAW